MVGIGGSGMSGLARVLRGLGAAVTGSDHAPSETTAGLEDDGVRVTFDQQAGLLPGECRLVIASAAVPDAHPELAEARRRGVEVIRYAQALGRCMAGRTGIAVAGTHGKSSTTAMLGSALVDAGLDPTVIVGATCRGLLRGNLGCLATPAGDAQGTGFRLGADRVPSGVLAGAPGLMVVEACEFNRSFHHLRPTIASIASVEADHLDIYGSLDKVVEAFAQFASLLPHERDGGRLLIAHDGAHRREVTAGLQCAVETIGYTPEADWVVRYDPQTRRVALARGRDAVAEWVMRVPGSHMAMNAAVAVALGVSAGAQAKVLAASLCEFRGVDRRMQFLGERGAAVSPGGSPPVRVYDDYGHHPTEVDVTLRALRDFERPQDRGGRLICVFQPHQHSRTRHLLDEFARSFEVADIVIVPEIYFVRDSEEERQKVTSADLVDRLRERGVRAKHAYPFAAIVEELEAIAQPGDLVVSMGAGPVYQVARQFLANAPRAGGGAT